MTTQLVVKTSKSGKTSSLWLRAFGKDVKVIGMWESFHGWYWYATEIDKSFKDTMYFGFVQGFEGEWGYFTKSQLENGSIWKVPKKNWTFSGRGNRITEVV